MNEVDDDGGELLLEDTDQADPSLAVSVNPTKTLSAIKAISKKRHVTFSPSTEGNETAKKSVFVYFCYFHFSFLNIVKLFAYFLCRRILLLVRFEKLYLQSGPGSKHN